MDEDEDIVMDEAIKVPICQRNRSRRSCLPPTAALIMKLALEFKCMREGRIRGNKALADMPSKST